jgi:REP element-mobilizing transposase RayT
MRAELKYPAVRFSQQQIDCIARGFADAMAKFQIELYACAILWDHVHIVSPRHREPIEFVARILKSAATRRLTQERLHPLANFSDPDVRPPTPWAEGGWERYLNDKAEIKDAINYVNNNPSKHNLPLQNWSFITKLDA